MRPFAFIGGSCVLIAAALACSSFSSEPTVDPAVDAGSEATTPVPTPDAGDASMPLCAPSGDLVFCNDFDIDASDPNATLFPNPSRSVGDALDRGTISLVDIDGSVGGSAPHAASVAIQKTDAGIRSKVILVDGLDMDHLTCGFDLLVDGAPTTEPIHVFHIYPISNDVAPRGADVQVIPSSDGTFAVELHYDVGAEVITIGSLTHGTFRHIEVSIAKTGELSGSVENRAAGKSLMTNPDGGIRALSFGISRSEAANILLDNIRCTK